MKGRWWSLLLLFPCVVLVLNDVLAPSVAASVAPTDSTAPCGKPLCTWNAFGPRVFKLHPGGPRLGGVLRPFGPETLTEAFSVLNIHTRYTLHVETAGRDFLKIRLNGRVVLDQDDVRQRRDLGRDLDRRVDRDAEERGRRSPRVIVVDKPVDLLAFNTLSVEMSGERSGTVEVTIVGVDDDPPSINVSAAPPANSHGWNNRPVGIDFVCADETSGIAVCPAPRVLTQEGRNQRVTGTAIDRAGNRATASVETSIDRTPPVLAIASPVSGSVVTGMNLPITGTVSDDLSGVAAVSCNGSPAVLNAGRFRCNVPLASGGNAIPIQAIDVAGNAVSSTLNVTFNPVSGPPPSALFVTPSALSLLVGQTANLALVSDLGNQVTGASWQSSDNAIVGVSAPASQAPALIAHHPGQAIVTATLDGLTASVHVAVLTGNSFPIGAQLWTVAPMGDGVTSQMGVRDAADPDTPTVFSVEDHPSGISVVRAFTADGRQLWTAQDGGQVPVPSASSSSQAPPAHNPASGTASKLPPSLLRLIRPPALPKRLNLVTKTLAADDSAPPNETVRFTVFDNDGGVIRFIDRGPTQSLVRRDAQTGAQLWRYDSPMSLLSVGNGVAAQRLDVTQFALHPDGTIYIVESAVGCPDVLVGDICSDAHVLALDGATGKEKFRTPIPPSHTSGDQICDPSFGIEPLVFDFTTPSDFGPVTVALDGSVNLEVAPFTLQTHILPGCFGQSVGLQTNLQRLQIQPDGSSALLPLTTVSLGGTDFDPIPHPLVGEVVPDNHGGLLNAWTLFTQTPTNATPNTWQVQVIHQAGDGSQQAYPLAVLNQFPLTDLVAGEDGVFYAGDGLSVEAFQGDTGLPVWTDAQALNSPAEIFGLLQALPDGLMASGGAGGLMRFDNAGNATPFNLGLNNLALVPPDRGYGVTPDGQAVAVQGPMLEEADAFFNYVGGDKPGHFAPSTPEFQFQKVITAIDGTTSNVPLMGIANQQTESVQITSKSSFKVQLSLEKDPEATGAATFADGTTTMTVTTPATVRIKGVNPSATADDLRLVAKIADRPVSMRKFSVVSVSLTLRTGNNLQVTPSNSGIDAYNGIYGTVQLGPFASFKALGCNVGVEITGNITPSNYSGKVVLKRTLVSNADFDATSLLGSLPNGDDTSDDPLRDDIPQQAHVFDLDAPGAQPKFARDVVRLRANLKQYAVLDSLQNTISAAKSDLLWFARVSCQQTLEGPSLLNDISNDNQAALGITSLTLKP